LNHSSVEVYTQLMYFTTVLPHMAFYSWLTPDSICADWYLYCKSHMFVYVPVHILMQGEHLLLGLLKHIIQKLTVVNRNTACTKQHDLKSWNNYS